MDDAKLPKGALVAEPAKRSRPWLKMTDVPQYGNLITNELEKSSRPVCKLFLFKLFTFYSFLYDKVYVVINLYDELLLAVI